MKGTTMRTESRNRRKDRYLAAGACLGALLLPMTVSAALDYGKKPRTRKVPVESVLLPPSESARKVKRHMPRGQVLRRVHRIEEVVPEGPGKIAEAEAEHEAPDWTTDEPSEAGEPARIAVITTSATERVADGEVAEEPPSGRWLALDPEDAPRFEPETHSSWRNLWGLIQTVEKAPRVPFEEKKARWKAARSSRRVEAAAAPEMNLSNESRHEEGEGSALLQLERAKRTWRPGRTSRVAREVERPPVVTEVAAVAPVAAPADSEAPVVVSAVPDSLVSAADVADWGDEETEAHQVAKVHPVKEVVQVAPVVPQAWVEKASPAVEVVVEPTKVTAPLLVSKQAHGLNTYRDRRNRKSRARPGTKVEPEVTKVTRIDKAAARNRDVPRKVRTIVAVQAVPVGAGHLEGLEAMIDEATSTPLSAGWTEVEPAGSLAAAPLEAPAVVAVPAAVPGLAEDRGDLGHLGHPVDPLPPELEAYEDHVSAPAVAPAMKLAASAPAAHPLHEELHVLQVMRAGRESMPSGMAEVPDDELMPPSAASPAAPVRLVGGDGHAGSDFGHPPVHGTVSAPSPVLEPRPGVKLAPRPALQLEARPELPPEPRPEQLARLAPPGQDAVRREARALLEELLGSQEWD